MINRIFFIAEHAFSSGDLLSPEESVYYSIWADPGIEGSLKKAYAIIGCHNIPPMALTLEIRTPLSPENIILVTSFLFIPSYLTIDHRPVINLAGNSVENLTETAHSLSVYLSSQGVDNPILNIVLQAGKDLFPPLPDLLSVAGNSPGRLPAEGEKSPFLSTGILFRTVEELTAYYKILLQKNSFYGHNLLIRIPSVTDMHFAFSALQEAEAGFRLQSPLLYSLVHDNTMLQKELHSLRRKYMSMEAELGYQKQYADILRSDHAARELQDYYTREYEVLPLWYKRFGHILKVLIGKRAFKSLFRDGVKKYKN